MTTEEKAADYDLIREFVADTLETKKNKDKGPAVAEPLEAWAFRQLCKRFFSDLA